METVKQETEQKEVVYTVADLEAMDKKIAELEQGLLEHRRMRAAIKALVPKRPLPLNQKQWVMIDPTTKTTSILKVVDRTRIAVSRAFLSEQDTYDRIKGIYIAQSKMRNFIELFEKTGLDSYVTEKTTGYTRDENNKPIPVVVPDKVIFKVGALDVLTDEEKTFHAKFIAPRMAELDEPPKAN